MPVKKFGGQSMTAPVRSVMVCPPHSAGWNRVEKTTQWPDLGFQAQPDFAAAQAHFEILKHRLEECGATVYELTPSENLSLDAIYAHDASFMTDYGAICLRMGKPNRTGEPGAHRRFYESLDIPILGKIEAPGTVEAGDIVWLDSSTLLIGRSYRTNDAGIEQMRELLAPHDVEVISAPLPHGLGPHACLHLMSLISLLDERTALVDSSWLSIQTVELLQRRKFKFIDIAHEERDTLACNVLALGDGRLLAFEENVKTNKRLYDFGFKVATLPGSEIGIKGNGGPTCLTRPLLRR